jgi:hypothetical protein
VDDGRIVERRHRIIIILVPTREEMQAALDKMKAAEKALRAYVDGSPDIDGNPSLHRKLAEELMKANEEFLRLFGSSS